MWWLIAGAFVAVQVLLAMGLCRAAGRSDRESERHSVALMRLSGQWTPSTFGLPASKSHSRWA